MPRLLLAVSLLLLAAIPAAAQPEPRRPALPAAADTNDWEAHYDQGVALLRARRQIDAEAHFYWASRLDPSRAEPLYARWVAFWARDPKRYMRYQDGERHVLEAADVVRADTLRDLALDRNPLVYQGLQVLILDQLPTSRWKDDVATLGYLSYSQLQFDRANEQFQRAIERQPRRNLWARYYRALSFTAQQRYDSAATQMQLMLADLRARDETEVAQQYFSKAFVEYAVGRLALARGDAAGAVDAFGRALGEDLAFVPAHEWLAQLALARGDAEGAVRELAQSVELRERDGVLRWAYGRALGAAGRDDEAVVQLRRAVELEPHFAEPYFSLALAFDRQGEHEQALATYGRYLERAPRAAPNAVRARARVTQLAENGVR